MVLLDETLRIRPEQTKTNLFFDIVAPRDFDRIEIDASYAPKFVTDPDALVRMTLEGGKKWGMLRPDTATVKAEDCPEICNMVVLSLDINGRFCGYAHRHDPMQHIVVSERMATPGFHPMKPEKGVWRLMLAICMAATPELTYQIRVSALPDEVTA